MSTELVLRVWTENPEISAKERFLQLIDILTAGDRTDGPWRSLTVIEDKPPSEILQLDGPLTTSDIKDALSGYDGERYRFSTRTTIGCWRVNHSMSERSLAQLWVESGGLDFMEASGRRHDIEGDGRFCIVPATPYRKPESNPRTVENTLRAERADRLYQDNVKELFDILLSIGNELRPASMKIFTGDDPYNPLNAGAVFFRDEAQLIKNFNTMKEIWHSGIPEYHIAPTEGFENPDNSDFMEEKNSRSFPQMKIAELIKHIDHISPGDIAGIDWSRFDILESPNGRAVLRYPDFVNAFACRFYLEVLAAHTMNCQHA